MVLPEVQWNHFKGQGYPTLPSDDSVSRIEMEEQQAPMPDNMDILLKQLQQIQVKQEMMERRQENKQKKEDEQSFARTWEETVSPETHVPIARVIGYMEKPKQGDVTLPK